MATKPKAILSTHDGREASPITKASNVLFENGQTAQDILNDRQDAMISPVIENSSSMFKVGQGDNVDYSNNVVNGAYESMVLKGKSMVNCIQEPSSQDVVLPYEFEEGQYVTINDTKESGALGVELKGQTLVNSILSIDKTLPYTWVSNDIASRACALRGAFKTGVYALIVEFGEVLLGGVQSSQGVSSAIQVNYTDGTSNSYTRSGLENYSKQRFFTTFTINKEVASVEFKGTAAQYENVTTEGYVPPTVTINKIMILEYQEGMENWDIPYFEGMTSCKMPILTTVGKNLADINNSTTNNIDKIYIPCYLVKGNNYTITTNVDYSGRLISIQTINDEEVQIISNWGVNNKQFTFNGETGKYLILIWRGSLISEYPNIQVQLEQGLTETSYEPYKSSILSLPEEVVLRKIRNVYETIEDALSCSTGIMKSYVNELTLNGSEDWNLYRDRESNTIAFMLHVPHGRTYQIGVMSCDKVPVYTQNEALKLEDKEWCFYNDHGSPIVFINVLRSKLTSPDVAGFKTWLRENNVKIQYPSETPIVTKINLPSTLKSWNTTTHIYSEIPENTLYPILSYSNPTYPVILKPSTKYSIVANSYSNNHTNSTVNFNLGGATASATVGNRVTTITTPSTLSNELLTMSGRGNKLNNVMVIEGDVVGDEPYFEGICDCKSPILSNVGKNLFGIDLTLGAHTYGNVGVKPTHGTGYPRVTNKTGDYIIAKPNATYTFSIDNNISFGIAQLDNSGNSLGDTGWVNNRNNWTITTHRTTRFIGFNFKKVDDSDITVEEVRNASPMLEESTTATPYKPYKSNILSCNGDEIKLTEDMFEQGGVSYPNTYPTTSTFDSIKYPSDHRIRMKDLHSIKPNTTHKIKIQNGDSYWIGLQGYNNDGVPINFDTSWGWHGGECVFTTPSNMTKFAIAIRKPDSSVITLSDFGKIEFELREVDKTIVLRSLPNGVCDTLNVETGEYVQRIGELVVNGDNTVSYTAISTGAEKTIRVAIAHSSIKIVSNESVICAYCNNLGYKYNYQDDKDFESFFVANSNNRIFMRLAKSKLETLDIAGVKKYFSKNPYIFQYELAKPIVSTVDVQGFPYAYANGHVQLSSGSIEQSLTPRVEYSVATNRNGQIRSNQKMVERHQKQLDQLQAIILANLVNSQYNQTLTTLKYELSRV